MKRLLIAALAILVLVVVLISRSSSPEEDKPSLTSQKSGEKTAARVAEPEDKRGTPEHEAAVRRFSQMLMGFVHLGYTPEQALAALQAMHAQNPKALAETMMLLENAPEELNRQLLPLLGEAFVLWPEVEGVYLAFLGYPYQTIMPTEAAEWANKFLVTNELKDLVAAAVIGNLALTDEPRAFELAANLPEAAKVKAIGTLADSVDVSDPGRLIEIAREWDPDGESHFTERIFIASVLSTWMKRQLG